jgi:sarcosine oxidase subunit beta
VETAEVVIVGGGVVGVSIAYHLAKLGARGIVLLEREGVLGSGSTARCAGGIRQQFGTAVNVLLSQWSLGFLSGMREETGTDPGLHQVGYLLLTADAARFAAMRDGVDLQRSLGAPVQVLTRAEIAQRFPYIATDDLAGGTFCPADGYADPHAVVQGMAARARAAGVAIRTGAEATGIRVAGGRIAGVETRDGVIAAPVVVNAAGPYAGAVGRMAGVEVPVEPVRRQIYVTAPYAGLPHDLPMIIDFDTSSYVRGDRAGLLMGASDPAEPPSFRTDPDEAGLLLVAETIMRRVPALAEAEIAGGWAGLYEVSPDENGVLGPVPERPGLFLANGFSGHGFQQAPAVGRVLAEMILGRPPFLDVSALSITRFRDGRLIRESAAV